MAESDSTEPKFGPGDVEILERNEAFRGYFRVDRYKLRHRLHRGGWSGEMTREVFERGNAAARIGGNSVGAL